MHICTHRLKYFTIISAMKTVLLQELSMRNIIQNLNIVESYIIMIYNLF